MTNENNIRDKDHKRRPLWAQIKELYDAAQAENPEKLSKRNENQIKGRYKRLNDSALKWIAAYQEACHRKTSEMGEKDVENEAHKIYEESGSKFHDTIVFNEVMCKHPNWDIHIDRVTTHFCPKCEEGSEENGNKTKRSRFTEEGDYCVNPNLVTTNSGGSTIQHSIDKDASTRKEKCMTCNEYAAELRAMRLNIDNEVEIIKTRLELDLQKEKLKEKRVLMKMQLVHLNTLLQKESLSHEEENMKRFLISKFYGT